MQAELMMSALDASISAQNWNRDKFWIEIGLGGSMKNHVSQQ
jgi:hypothetical protein